MNNQPHTPEQKIKRAKLILWLGIAIIIIIGLSVAVYFVFVKIAGQGNVNVVENVNVTTNVNKVVNTNVDTSDWQTYENTKNGYSIKYPADYLIKMEMDDYVVFDPASLDTPNTTYLHISVTVEDNDFHTYRLGVLTDPSVQSGSASEEDVTIDGLSGKKITLKNALGETIVHYIVNYLGKVYDISAGDSVDSQVLDGVVSSFDIKQLGDDVDITNTNEFSGKACVSNNDCGAFPCVNNECLVQKCSSDSDCPNGLCGLHATPVPGYCTTMDVL